MNLQRTSLAAAALLAAASASQAATAGLPTGLDWIDSNTNLTFYGDLRLRFEADWDSQNAAGVERDDRNRGRLRARAGFNYKVSDAWSFGSRIRTGSSRSQQSPHLTFAADDGLRDDLDFVADRYFIQFKQDAFTGWAGRNTSPFWQQNELFWDEDVTPTGLAGTYDVKRGEGTLSTFQNYDAADVAPFPASDDDETFGFVLSASLGQLKKKHDWQVAYFYSHIETFAFNASYAQDDWVRFGNGPQTAGSDFEGHEVRLAYALSKNINVMARVYLVEAITTVQDGNRFRIDLNWKF